jgi:hypothetical protein
MEGHEPGLRVQLQPQQRRQLDFLGLSLGKQNPVESRDKSSGRTVVPTTQTKKEDIHMDTATTETSTNKRSNETATESHPSVDAVERNTARMAHATERLVAQFEAQHSFKTEALRIGATAVAAGLVTGLVIVGVGAMLAPAELEMAPAPGAPKK